MIFLHKSNTPSSVYKEEIHPHKTLVGGTIIKIKTRIPFEEWVRAYSEQIIPNNIIGIIKHKDSYIEETTDLKEYTEYKFCWYVYNNGEKTVKIEDMDKILLIDELEEKYKEFCENYFDMSKWVSSHSWDSEKLEFLRKFLKIPVDTDNDISYNGL